MHVSSRRTSPSEQSKILAHYERVAPLIVANFPNAPLIVAYYINGLGNDPTFSHAWHEPLPHSIPSVTCATNSVPHVYPACAENTILWLVHRNAVGMLSWTPSPKDPEAVGFARILFRPVGGATQTLLKEALLALRTALFEHGLEAIPLLEGIDSAALFIPLADAPMYDVVRAWLHQLVNHAIERHPTLLVHEAHPHEQHNAPRIECTAVSNAVGHFSRLPYSLAGMPDLPMVTPFDWTELGTLENGHITAANAHHRLAKGDIFATLAAELAHQRFADAARQ